MLVSVRKLYRSAVREMRRARNSRKTERLAYLASAAEYTELGMGFAVLEVQKFHKTTQQGDLFDNESTEQKRLEIVKELSRLSRLRIAAGLACVAPFVDTL